MTAPKLDRRQVLKLEAAAMAALPRAACRCRRSPPTSSPSATRASCKWDKAACRFCGTGCSVMVATKDNRVVATHGDIKAEVNRGLNCVKGYFLSKIMYGHDRLTQPLLRKTQRQVRQERRVHAGVLGRGLRRHGGEVQGRAEEARARAASACSAPASGRSGKATPRSKLFKAGFRSNNLDPNARHCMASAVAGFMRTFGIDEPMGCYDDIEAADAFVLWGSNMAEMHPILWTRVTDRRLSAPHVRVAVLSTFEHRSFDLADIGMVFKPQTDLYILNAIANHIIKTGRVNKDFVAEHTRVQARPDRHRLRPASRASAAEEGDRRRQGQRLHRHELRRVRQVRLGLHAGEGGRDVGRAARTASRRWPSSMPTRRSRSSRFWTMGFNQHTRGVWCNNLVYNIHLLTGKISEPGNSPFSLTGQPSACGTAREVGTFSHRLPADMVVTNKAHRDKAEQIWKLPEGTIPDKPGYHAVLQNRMLKDGLLNAYWVQVNNNLQAGANTNEETYPGYRNPDNFIVVSDAYPTVTALAADLDPADRDVGREGRRLRQCRAAHPVLAPAGRRARRGALRSLAADGVLQALQDRGGLAGGADRQEARISRQDAVRRALQERPGRQVSR